MNKEDYKQFTDKIKEMNAKIKAEGKELFWWLAKEVFNSNPELKSFGWKQYTPYFMDGDPCEFSVHSDSVFINDGLVGRWSLESTEPAALGFSNKQSLARAVNQSIALLGSIEEDHMRMIFGDHTQITVFDSGKVEVEAYDHE